MLKSFAENLAKDLVENWDVEGGVGVGVRGVWEGKILLKILWKMRM